MALDRFDRQVTDIAALGEPIRRALYRFVVAQNGPVSRDAAAEGVGVARHVAKFHLDRLEADGLLEAEFSRPPGRSGPGAGRPSKRYRRAARELSVSLPERRYDLAGRLMAAALMRAGDEGLPVVDALTGVAESMGRSIGEEVRERSGVEADAAELLATLRQVLTEYGYEPQDEAGGLTLANCPFHALAQEYTDLVCGMNLDLLRGVLAGLGATGLEARLEPAPGRCCVMMCQ